MEKGKEQVTLDISTYNELLRTSWDYSTLSRKKQDYDERLLAEVNKMKVEVNKRAAAMVGTLLSKVEGVEVKIDIDFTKIIKELRIEGTGVVKILKAKYDD